MTLNYLLRNWVSKEYECQQVTCESVCLGVYISTFRIFLTILLFLVGLCADTVYCIKNEIDLLVCKTVLLVVLSFFVGLMSASEPVRMVPFT